MVTNLSTRAQAKASRVMTADRAVLTGDKPAVAFNVSGNAEAKAEYLLKHLARVSSVHVAGEQLRRESSNARKQVREIDAILGAKHPGLTVAVIASGALAGD